MAAMSTELEKRKEEEYEMQLFGFNSRAVHATLERIVEERIQSCCKKLWESLERIYKPSGNDEMTHRSDGKRLVKLYRSRSRTHANTMKKCTKKFVTVPRNVLLDEDKGQEIQYTEEEFRRMKKHLEDLQARAKRATMLRAALEEEIHLTKELECNEKVAGIITSSMENSLLNSDIDKNLIRGVENFRALEKIVRQSSATITNVYKSSVNDIRVKALDLVDSRPES